MGSRTLEVQLDSLLAALHSQVGWGRKWRGRGFLGGRWAHQRGSTLGAGGVSRCCLAWNHQVPTEGGREQDMRGASARDG